MKKLLGGGAFESLSMEDLKSITGDKRKVIIFISILCLRCWSDMELIPFQSILSHSKGNPLITSPSGSMIMKHPNFNTSSHHESNVRKLEPHSDTMFAVLEQGGVIFHTKMTSHMERGYPFNIQRDIINIAHFI